MIQYQLIDQNKIFILDQANEENKDFSGKDLVGFYIADSYFKNCLFENLKVKSMYFGGGNSQSVFINCSFNRSVLEGPTGGNARFENCSFLDVNLHNFFFHRNEFINCIFSGNLNKLNFHYRLFDNDVEITNRQTNEFYGNNFSEAKLNDVNFSGGIDLTLQILPKDDNHICIYNAPEVLEKFKQAVELKDENFQRIAYPVIKTLEYRIIQGQQTQYLYQLKKAPYKEEVENLLLDIVASCK